MRIDRETREGQSQEPGGKPGKLVAEVRNMYILGIGSSPGKGLKKGNEVPVFDWNVECVKWKNGKSVWKGRLNSEGLSMPT